MPFVERNGLINAHFLSCFIALVIARLLEKKMDYAFPLSRIIDTMNKISCSLEDENLYLFDYRNEISDAIGVNFSQKRRRLSDIKNILANCKK